MREIRYITDDRDKDYRTELVIQHGGNGDIYVTTVDEGKKAISGVRLATSGGAATAVPDLVFGIMNAFNKIYEQASKDPDWAKNRGITISD